MSSFTTELEVSPMPDGRRWKLLKRFTYHVGYEGSKDKISVPAGFITDFASVPNVFWTLLPAWGKYGKAAVVHDYLYQTCQDTNLNFLRRIFSKKRKRADKIFKEAMQVLAVKEWKVFVMYWAVRIGGWLAWNENVIVAK